MLRRVTFSPTPCRRLAWAALAFLVLIVFSGAGVRLTGSGLGCPDWPRCHGGFTPELNSHVAIEYGNRLLSSLVGLVSIAAGVAALRRRPFRRDLIVPGSIVMIGVVAQGVLGGITVLLDLEWQVVIAHYLLSMALIAAAAVLVWRQRSDEPSPPPTTERLIWLATRVLVVYGALVVIAGTFATAAGPHAGGAGTGDVVARLDAWGAATLKDVIHIHGHMAAVLGFLSIALWGVAWWRKANRALRAALTALCIGIGIQGIVGLVQYHNARPATVVWVHASLGALLWLSLIWCWLGAGRPVPERAAARRPARATPLTGRSGS
jgi:cytochrome c oxidase assembly protein subunit 15